MGKIAKDGEINFNYPIPKSIHKKVKLLQLDTGMAVKDIVVNALILYISHMDNLLNEEHELEKIIHESHGTIGEDEDYL